ncbi:MAG: dTDP-4-dehydrorhamnose 3,5-epimerase [Rhizobiaceae bacterium]
MQVLPTALPEVLEIVPKKHGDARGFFSEVYNAERFREAGIDFEWVQDNHALSGQAGVLRALHYQLPPVAQDKLVRVARGRIFDVAVDIRKGSPRYGQWVGVELSAQRWNQLFVPKGFLHGYVTLEPDTEVLYKVTAPYAPQYDRGVRFDDPDIGVIWPLAGLTPILSDKDRNAPLLRDAENSFVYEVPAP